MSAVLEASALTKSYKGVRALDAIDLSVAEGSIFGLLGPNGAGKTTMLRLIAGLAHPTTGVIRVLGHDVSASGNAVRAQLGFVPDVPTFYDWMTAKQFMHFAGGLFGMERRLLTKRSGMLLDSAGLGGVSTHIGGFSRGMRQRLGIAQALVNAPRLLLLDEPTSALDPIGRKDVLDMIESLRGRTTIFFSTHILSDVERVCDTVAILNRGRLLTQASIADLRVRYGTHAISIEVSEGADALASAIAGRPWAASVARGGVGTIEVTVTDVHAAQCDIPAIIAGQKTGLVKLEAAEVGLEAIFVELIGAANA